MSSSDLLRLTCLYRGDRQTDGRGQTREAMQEERGALLPDTAGHADRYLMSFLQWCSGWRCERRWVQAELTSSRSAAFRHALSPPCDRGSGEII